MSIELAPTISGTPIRRWKRYPAYRDSGVEWLGEVPEEWKVRKLKHIASVKPSNVDKKTVEGEHPVRLCNYVDVYYNDYITSDLDLMKATASVVEIEKFILRKGDILITKDSESWDDIAVPAYVSSDFNNVLCGYHLAQIRPNTALSDGEYQFRSFCADDINDQFRVAATGITRYGLGKYWIDNSLFLVPPKDEQRAIAAFLDRETGRIDTLIEKKERQIELLQEKRAALISHVVTKGLDPDVKMRDSGVEWLGEVPEHWEIMNFKRIGKVRYGLGQPPSELNDGVPLIRATNINRGKISDEGMLFINPDEVPESRDAVLSEGEIIIVRSGAYTGDSAIIPFKYAGAIAGYDTVLTIKKGINRYFAWQILSKEIQDLQFGFNKLRAAQPHLNAEEINKTIIVNPLLEEQRTIAAFLDRETERIDTLTIKVRESLSKLREYRTALISAAVTGKIDVRGEFVS